MKKTEFLSELQTKLAGLPEQDLEERLGFYGEMIDDKMEEGIPEDEAVAQIDTTDEIVSQIVAEYPLAKIVKETVKPKRRLRPWEIVLLIVGSPLWLSLLIAAFAVALSLYITLWSLIISLWAVFLCFAACSVGGIVLAAVYTFTGNVPAGLMYLGVGLFCAGCAILLFYGSMAASKGTLLLTRKMFTGIKALLIGKEHSK